jgi:hypothetical protein
MLVGAAQRPSSHENVRMHSPAAQESRCSRPLPARRRIAVRYTTRAGSRLNAGPLGGQNPRA